MMYILIYVREENIQHIKKLDVIVVVRRNYYDKKM